MRDRYNQTRSCCDKSLEMLFAKTDGSYIPIVEIERKAFTIPETAQAVPPSDVAPITER